MNTTTAHRVLASLLLAAALVVTGCGSDDDDTAGNTADNTAATTAPVEELVVEDVWARTSPMAVDTGAVYLTMTSPVDDRLIGAEVPTTVAAKTEIHETVEVESTDSTTTMGTDTTMGTAEGMGEMTMRPVEFIELPAGETVELKPGGYHVMLMGLVEPLETGDSFEVTLTFEEAGEVVVSAEVRES